MKKLVTMTFLALAGAVAGSAASITISCTPFPVDFGPSVSTTGTATCTLTAAQTAALVGQTITQVQFNLFENFNGGDGSTSTTASVKLTAPAIAGVVFGSPNITATSCPSVFLCSSPTVTDASTSVAAVNAVGTPLTVNLASTIAGVAGNNAGYVWEIITYTNTNATPEPATMLLLGTGLIACGLLRRRVR